MVTTLDTAVHCAVVYGGTSGGCTVVFWVRSKTPYKPTVQNPTVHGNYHRTMYGGCASAQTVYRGQSQVKEISAVLIANILVCVITEF